MNSVKPIILTTLVLSFALTVLLVPSNVRAADDEKVSAPVRERGDFWRFQVRGKEVTASRSNSIFGAWEIVFTGTEYRLFRRQAGINTEIGEYYNFSQLDLEPTPSELIAFLDFKRVWTYLQFPFSVGQRWSTSYTAYTVMGNTHSRFSISAETRVVGKEDITVQGGTFKTFKIERQAIATGNVGNLGSVVTQDISYLYFYAPAAGAIVKYDRKGGGSRVIVELRRNGRRTK